MHSTRTRLDRFMSVTTGINRRDVKLMLAQGRIAVDGLIATEVAQIVHEFSHIALDTYVLQAHVPRYLMLHKPSDVVSATKDEHHKTVIDLLDKQDAKGLHIAGRLDLNSSGLVLLTDDGRWSRALSTPDNAITKVYQVRLQNAISEDYIEAFAAGMYFPFEDITTRPATLKIINEHVAEVTLIEGRYHQIKRMFGRFRNPVLSLHRSAIGSLLLDDELKPEQYRKITHAELNKLNQGLRV